MAVCALLYCVWMTGGTFRFPEIERFPNHLMLARAFASGRLDISEAPRVDVASFAGRRYFYFGPVPAAIRTPLELLGIDPPTGLMVCLLAAAVVGLFAALVRELSPDRRFRWLERVFVASFAVNGLTLFMVGLPSVHHESILWAVLFLLVALLLLVRALRVGPRPRLGWLLGTAAALAVGSRFSYLPAAALVVTVAAVAGVRRSAGTFLRSVVPAVTPLVLMLAALLLYNAARFRDPFEFGMARSASRYQDYLRAGNFWRLDHVPYNLWDYLARLPEPTSRFPYLEATITLSEVTRRTAVPRPPYRLLHVNELALSTFVLVPLTALLFFSPGRVRSRAGPVDRRAPAVLLGLAVVQLGVLSFAMASTARYMFDFAPLLLLLAFLGAAGLAERRPVAARSAVTVLALLTLAVSLLLPLSAAAQYGPFLGYHGPLSMLMGSAP